MSALIAELGVEIGKEIGKELCKGAIELGKEAHRQYSLYKARRTKATASSASEPQPIPSASPAPVELTEGLKEPEQWQYEGEFVNGELEGPGKMTTATKRYVGMFHKGVFHGEGTMEYLTTGRKYVGEFADGTYHGNGVYFGTTCTYSGTFKEGDFVYGLIMMPQGGRFEGECEQYVPKHGTFFTKRGFKYIGGMNKFTFEGQGKLIYPVRYLDTGELTSAVYYEGTFVNGKYHGEGVIVWRNGKKWRGQWADGKMVKTDGEYIESIPEELLVSSSATF